MHDELEQHVLRDRAYLDLVHRTALEYWEGPCCMFGSRSCSLYNLNLGLLEVLGAILVMVHNVALG